GRSVLSIQAIGTGPILEAVRHVRILRRLATAITCALFATRRLRDTALCWLRLDRPYVTRSSSTCRHQNSFNPGGSGRPPVRFFIFSCSSVSALRRASAWAATMRSSVISFSSGFISDRSRVTDLTSPFAVIFIITIPPPAVPSTSRWSSSACIASILDLSSAACFIKPMKSPIFRLSSCAAPPPAGRSNPLPRCPAWRGGWESDCLQIIVHIVAAVVAAEYGSAIINRHFAGQLFVINRYYRRRGFRFRPPHGHDLGARKARQHALHQRISLDAALEFLTARRKLRPHRRLSSLGRHRDHPASPGKCREPPAEITDQRIGGAGLE